MSGFEQFPVCPYCGGVYHDWWDVLGGEVYDGSKWITVCSACSKEYAIRARVRTTFVSDKVPATEVSDDET